MAIPKTVLDCAVVRDPTDREGFRMKYTIMGNKKKETRFCDAEMDPYMFIKRSDRWVLQDFKDRIQGVYDNGEFETFKQEQVIRVDMPGPKQTGEFRDVLEKKFNVMTYESDIPFVRRWFIDKGIRQPMLEKILYVDIEVDARKQFCTPAYPEGRILSIAAIGSDGNEYFICNRDERYMLRHFYNLIGTKYEVITGWNFCLHPDTRVYIRNKGKIPISEVEAGDEVFGISGWQRIKLRASKQFKGNLHRIGNGPLCTPEHRIPVFDDRRYIKMGVKEASEVVPDKDKLMQLMSPIACLEDLTRKEKLSELAGIVFAEGTFVNKEYPYYSKARQKVRIWKPHRVQIAISSDEIEFRDRILWLFRDLWGYEASVRSNGPNGIVVVSNKKNIFNELYHALMEDHWNLMDSASFLRGFFEGDGSAIRGKQHRCVSAAQSSWANILTIAAHLREVGIPYRLSEYTNRAFGEERQFHKVVIRGYETLLAFSAKVGFISSVKRTKLFNAIDSLKQLGRCRVGTVEYSRVNDIEEIPYEGEVIDISLEGKPYFFADDFLVHNCGDTMYGVPFDWPYILARTKLLNFRRMFIPIQQMDAYRAYLRFTDYETKGVSNSLDSVGHRVLGIGKFGKYNADKAWDSLINDPEHKWLYEYNMQDARLVKMIDEELRVLHPYIVSATKLPVFLRDLDKMSVVWEAMLLDRCRVANPRPVFPRKRMTEFGDVRGALTFEPVPGVHDNVLVLDYSGLYIAVMQLLGISPEMISRFQSELEDEGIDPKDMMKPDFLNSVIVRRYAEFVQSQSAEPLYKEILVGLSSTRREQKAELKNHPKDSLEYMYFNAAQKFTKTLLVSGYGVQGLKKKKMKRGLSRFHSPLMANMITFVARAIQMWTKEYFEKRGWTVTYGDTDSCFLTHPAYGSFDLGLMAEELSNECTIHVRKWISEIYAVTDTSFLFIKAEKAYKEIIHGLEQQKKRYMGWIVWTENQGFVEKFYDVVGAEQKRSDSFELLKEVENTVTELMFQHRENGRFYVDEYIVNLRRQMLDRQLDNKLIIEKGMNKPPQEYAKGNQLRRIAEQLLERGEHRPGERVRWVLVRNKPSKGEYALGADELTLPENVKIDHTGYLYYMDRIKKMVDRWVPSATEQLTMEVFSS